MREMYRAFMARVRTTDARGLAHDLEHWHDSMEAHETSLSRLGFAPDGHAEWEGCSDAREQRQWGSCPHAQTQRLWAQAVRVLGSRADELTYLHARAHEAQTGPHWQTHVQRIPQRR